MALLCRLFGHRRFGGWYGDGLYGRVEGRGEDGIGEKHFAVVGDCDRCGEEYTLARFHGSGVDRAIGKPRHVSPGMPDRAC